MALRELKPRAWAVLPGHRSSRLRFWLYQLLILPPYTEPHSERALSGTGTSTMSRGTWNIATCLVSGSMDTTIRVSVLKLEPSPSRASTPIARMFSRSLPSHGGRVGASVPCADGSGVGITAVGLAAGSCDAPGSALSSGPCDPRAVGGSVAFPQSSPPSSLKMQLTSS